MKEFTHGTHSCVCNLKQALQGVVFTTHSAWFFIVGTAEQFLLIVLPSKTMVGIVVPAHTDCTYGTHSAVAGRCRNSNSMRV